MTRFATLITLLAAAALLAAPLRAADDPAKPAAATKADDSKPAPAKPAPKAGDPAASAAGKTAKPAPGAPAKAAGDTAAPSADDVRKKLLQKVEQNPLIQPSRPLRPSDAPGVAPQADPRIVGVAPGLAPSKLRRQGEFIVARRGRLIRATGASQVVFAFDADSADTPEPPMVLMPCQLLQDMEDLAQERGDKVVFILSGQVFVYRSANYLLPTMMKLAIDRGNLQN